VKEEQLLGGYFALGGVISLLQVLHRHPSILFLSCSLSHVGSSALQYFVVTLSLGIHPLFHSIVKVRTKPALQKGV
jgi:hypothetical protein